MAASNQPSPRAHNQVRDEGAFLQPTRSARVYRSKRHPVSGLPVMIPARPGGRKVTPREIARLNSELM